MSDQTQKIDFSDRLTSVINRYGNWIFLFLFLAMPLFFILYTGNIWEDFFITFKYSENLAEGNGLVHSAGRKVHGFTSPLGVLLPALCHILTGRISYLQALWLFRIIFCLPAYAGAGLILMRSLRRYTAEFPLAPFFGGLLFLLEAKSIAFSTNGMETALQLLFTAWGLYLLLGKFHLFRSWLWLGMAWAGLMWTRPDSCVYVAAMGLATLVFCPIKRRDALPAMLKAAAVTTLLYLPWFIWSWHYYGTPVPHTILAKGGSLVSTGLTDMLVKVPICISWVFGPVYPHFGRWPLMILVYMIISGAFAGLYWLFGIWIKDRVGQQVSMIFFLLCIYLGFMVFPYPWYFPGVALPGIFVLVRGIFVVSRRWRGEFKARKTAAVILLLLIFLASMTCGLVFYQLRLQQRIIEDGNRIPLGKWLNEHIHEKDRVYLECLGYIGYFSGAEMRDYPGLATPEVVKLRREQKLNFYQVPMVMQPEWVVFRLHEFMTMAHNYPEFLTLYKPVASFNATDKINRYNFIPGEALLLYDCHFFVFHRRDLERGLIEILKKPEFQD